MAFDGGSILAQIKASVDNFKAGIETAKQQVDSFREQANKFSQTMKDAGARVAKFGRRMTTFVTLPIIGAAGAMVKAASDAEELESKFRVVFGDLADETDEWIDQVAKAWNRGRQDIRGYMAETQNMLVGMGASREAGLDLSKQIVSLATDLASFNNLAESDALASMQSALVGNHMAARSLGAVLNENTLAMAMERMGLQGKFQDLDELTKMQVRYNAILMQSEDAVGDAERTSGSFANQMRGLKASVKDLSVEIGTTLLPYATRLVSWVSRGVEWFSNLSDKGKNLTLIIAGIAAAIGPLVWIAGTLTTVIGLLAFPIGLIIAGLTLLGIWFVRSWKRSEEFRDKVKAILEGLKTFIEPIIETIKESFQMFVEALAPAWEALKDAFEAIKPVLIAVGAVIGAVLATALAIITGVVNGIIRAIAPLIQAIAGLFSFFVNIFNAIGALFRGDFSGALEYAKAALQGALDFFVGIGKAIWGFFSGLVEGIISFFKGLYNSLVGNSIIPDMVNGILEWIGSLPGKALEYVKKLVSNIIDTITGLPAKMFELGKDIINGLIDGIKNKATGAVDAVKGIGNSIIGGAKKLLGISSPSTIFEGFGENLGEGLARGVEATKRMVEQAAASISIAAMPNYEVSALASQGNSTNTDRAPIYQFAEGAIQILAKDLQEVQDVLALFERLPQYARARG